MRSGIKTTELWVTIGLAVAAAIFPDIPQEAITALVIWVVGRAGQKYFGIEDINGKRAWKTSEFWVAIGFAVAKSVFPDLPQEALVPVGTWVAVRSGSKMISSNKEIKKMNENNMEVTK